MLFLDLFRILLTLLVALAAPASVIPHHAAPSASPDAAVELASLEEASRALPARLVIPTLGVDAAIEHVGIDGTGAMRTPSTPERVAWYAPGVAPGEMGNAVIAGHVDSLSGAPAIFWDIDDLILGDRLLVVAEDGSEQQFVVKRSLVYDYETFDDEGGPLDTIFGFSLHKRLYLITCAGSINPAARGYTQRLVVELEPIYTTLPIRP